MDVCWFRLPRNDSDGYETGAFFIAHGRMLVCIPRTGEWQIGYVFPKGDFAQLRAQGIVALRDGISDAAPWLSDRVEVLKAFTDVHLLSVQGRIQDLIVKRALRNRPFELPLLARLALSTPGLRDIPARLFALGLPRTRVEI